MRPSGREYNALRQVSAEPDFIRGAGASCLISFGNTKVICTASLEERVPPFLRNSGRGWITAEYGMLPGATGERFRREAASGKQGGRTVEIQRLIGRSLRAAADLKKLGERQIIVDCDVIQADGGTRCASITGGYIALARLINKLQDDNILYNNPLTGNVCAVSCAIYKGQAVLDPDYAEDSAAEADANFAMNAHGAIAEAQCSAEDGFFPANRVAELTALAQSAAATLSDIQAEAIAA